MKAENVILALHPRGALTVRGSRTGAAQTDTGYSAGGGPESELHPHKSWGGAEGDALPCGVGERRASGFSICGSPDSICTPHGDWPPS